MLNVIKMRYNLCDKSYFNQNNMIIFAKIIKHRNVEKA